MTGVLGVFVLLYAGLLGCWALFSALRGRRLGIGYLGGLVLLELTLLVRAGLELAGLVAASAGPGGAFGRGYAEPAVHAGHLLASVVLLPLVLTVSAPATTRVMAEPGADSRPARGQGTWDALLAAVGCAAVVVVTLRMASTGRPG
jgi:hypothetical protein